MLQTIESINNVVNNFIWGVPAMICIIGVGLYLSLRTGFVQIRKFPYALKTTLGRIFKKKEASDGSMTPFQAVCTALAGTVGTGNIAGVAGAIAIGGPGAVFWMLVSALLGMCTKFTEVTLAVHFRERNRHGDYVGGPMYYIKNGLGKNWRFLAVLYSAFGVLTVFGTGNATQVNTITTAIDTALINFNVISESSTGRLNLILGIVITLLVGMVLLGGIKRIGSVSEKLVPFMALFYVVGCVIILGMNYDYIIPALVTIVKMAFTPGAVAGGLVGRGIMLAMRYGIARGLFSNESGMGSAPIAAAAAQTRNPVRQALVSATGTFWDTVVVCMLTGLVLVSTIMKNPAINANEVSDGGVLTSMAFSQIPVIGPIILVVGIISFAYSTVLGWAYYGERCVEYFGGKRALVPYRILYIIVAAIAPVAALDLVWLIADTLNAFMAIPNLIAVLALSSVIVAETRKYINNIDARDTTPVPVVKKYC